MSAAEQVRQLGRIADALEVIASWAPWIAGVLSALVGAVIAS